MRSTIKDILTKFCKESPPPTEIHSLSEAYFYGIVYAAFFEALDSAADTLAMYISNLPNPCDAVNVFSAWLDVTMERIDAAAKRCDLYIDAHE